MDEEKMTSGVDQGTFGEYKNESEPQKEGKALEICALVFGILAIVGCCCAGIFGLIGFVLSLMALVKGKKSGFSIAGLICSIIGLLMSIMLFAYAFSPAGQRVADEFWRGFRDAYEDNYQRGISEEVSEVESSDEGTVESDEDNEYPEDENDNDTYKTHKGTVTVSDNEIGTIIMDGNTIHIPVKVSHIRDLIEMDENSQKDMKEEISGHGSTWLKLATDGQSNGITLILSNNTESDIAVKDADVNGLWVNLWGDTLADVVFYGGIKVGQSKEELLDIIKDLTYVVMEEDGYSYYSMDLGDDEEFSFSITLEDDVIIDVELDYYNYD